MKILLFAPYGKDGDMLINALSDSDLQFEAHTGPDDLPATLDAEIGAIILTQEALRSDVLDALRDRLLQQETWSELPVLVLIDSRMQRPTVRDELSRRLPRSKMFLLSRPIRMVELETILSSVLRSRKRQISVSEHIEFQDTLQRELNHRVKNVIATVQGIYSITARQADDFASFQENFSGRLMALGGVHDILYKVDAQKPELAEIVAKAAAPFDIGEQRFSSSGDRVCLKDDAATMFALALHELFTNAIKYGALSRESGKIELSWQTGKKQEFLHLSWIEKSGPKVKPPERKGYGSKFLHNVFERNFDGSVDVDYRETGMVARLSAKLDVISR